MGGGCILIIAEENVFNRKLYIDIIPYNLLNISPCAQDIGKGGGVLQKGQKYITLGNLPMTISRKVRTRVG